MTPKPFCSRKVGHFAPPTILTYTWPHEKNHKSGTTFKLLFVTTDFYYKTCNNIRIWEQGCRNKHTFLGYLKLDQVCMEYVIFDWVKNELYIHSLHSVTARTCAEVEVPTLVKKMAPPYG